jgi:peptidoglycan hydrolase-like protein with peptidoglycan-binding domain
LLTTLGWNRRDAAAVAIGALATIAILVNVLFMQAGPHPAPMFKSKPAHAKPVAVKESALPPPTTATVPRPRPVEPAHAAPVSPVIATPLAPVLAAPAAPVVPVPPPVVAAGSAAKRTPGAIITDIQQELVRRGFFDGVVDGLYGPKTDRAIRAFERSAKLRPSREPSEALLQAIQRAHGKAAKTAIAATPVHRPAPVLNEVVARPTPVRNEVAAARPAPSKRVIAMQRVLAEFGYGQIKPTGLIDTETQAAIEKFERERRLPVTGQASDRVVRELASLTGRHLD